MTACTRLFLQLFGWLVASNTILEYLLAGSTVAKGFSGYFTVLIGAELVEPCQPLHCTAQCCLHAKRFAEICCECLCLARWPSSFLHHINDMWHALHVFSLQVNRPAVFSSVLLPVVTKPLPSS